MRQGTWALETPDAPVAHYFVPLNGTMGSLCGQIRGATSVGTEPQGQPECPRCLALLGLMDRREG